MSVRVPARADYVNLVRSVVAGAAAKASLSIDEIEDMRLAVDEACAHLLSLVPSSKTLTVDITSDPGVLELVACVDGIVSTSADADRSITWQILSALTDGASLEPSAVSTGIRMTKRVEP